MSEVNTRIPSVEDDELNKLIAEQSDDRRTEDELTIPHPGGEYEDTMQVLTSQQRLAYYALKYNSDLWQHWPERKDATYNKEVSACLNLPYLASYLYQIATTRIIANAEGAKIDEEAVLENYIERLRAIWGTVQSNIEFMKFVKLYYKSLFNSNDYKDFSMKRMLGFLSQHTAGVNKNSHRKMRNAIYNINYEKLINKQANIKGLNFNRGHTALPEIQFLAVLRTLKLLEGSMLDGKERLKILTDKIGSKWMHSLDNLDGLGPAARDKYFEEVMINKVQFPSRTYIRLLLSISCKYDSDDELLKFIDSWTRKIRNWLVNDWLTNNSNQMFK